MSTQDHSDEITFGQLAKGLKSLYHSFLIRMYRFLRFFIKHWMVLGALLILGLGLGYFMNNQEVIPQKAKFIVQINYSSGPVIYDAVDRLNESIANNDLALLEKYGLAKKGHSTLKDITIAPVVNIKDILNDFYVWSSKDEGMVDALIQQVIKEEEDPLTSPALAAQYKQHTIEISAYNTADSSTLSHLIAYLNSSEALQNAKATYQQSLTYKIHEHQLAIAQIDSLFQRLGETQPSGASGSQVLIDQGRNEDLHKLLKEKSFLLNTLEELQVQHLQYDDPVVVISPLRLIKDANFYTNKLILLPLLFIGIYMVITIIVAVFKKGKRLSQYKNS